MAVGLVDAGGGLHVDRQAPTPARGDGESMFIALVQLIDVVRGLGEAAGLPAPIVCGVGCGGPMTRRGETVTPINIPAWRAFPLRSLLREAIGLPVHVDNDAKALALGEGWVGAAVGCSNFVAMVVSTGVGGGVVLDGRLLDGAAGNAGHIGHMIVDPDGHECGCGARGCVEAEASGSAIERITGKPASEATPEVIDRAGMMVGRAIASVANLLDLQLAVVAGSVALGFGDPFFVAAQLEIDARARLDFSKGTVIRPAALGANGPLIGAAAVGFRAEGHDLGIA